MLNCGITVYGGLNGCVLTVIGQTFKTASRVCCFKITTAFSLFRFQWHFVLTSSQNTAIIKVKMSRSKKKLSKKIIFCLSLEAVEFHEGLEGFFFNIQSNIYDRIWQHIPIAMLIAFYVRSWLLDRFYRYPIFNTLTSEV